MNPVRLEKKVSAKEKREAWVNAHAHLILPVLVVLFFLFFIDNVPCFFSCA